MSIVSWMRPHAPLMQGARRLAALLAVPASVGAQRLAGVEHPVALVHATVIDVATGAQHRNATVVLTGEHITGVDSAGAPPRGARIVDAAGRYVIPGLWDMHVEEALSMSKRLPVDSNAAFFHPLFVAWGVTGVRDIAGATTTLAQWRDAIAQGRRIGPRIVYTGPKLATQDTDNATTEPLRSAADVAHAVGALRREGVDALYLSGSFDGTLLDTLAVTARQAGLPFEGLVPGNRSLWETSALGQHADDHLSRVLLACTRREWFVRRLTTWHTTRPWYARVLWKLHLVEHAEYPVTLPLAYWNDARAEALFAQLATAHTWQIPTLRMYGVLFRAPDSLLRSSPDLPALLAPRTPWHGWAAEPRPASHPLVQLYDRMLWTVGTMEHAGVGLLAGSDTPNQHALPGESLHDELALLVRAGLTPLEALRTATINPARFLGAADTLGTVRPGAVADLVVLDGDPTADIANTRRIAMVVARGRLFDRAALDAMIRRGREAAAWYAPTP